VVEEKSMRKAARVAFLTTLATLTLCVWAQDKSKTGEDAPAEARTTETTPVKVAVTFVEYEGDKKVKSLPYTLVVVADEKPPKGSQLKMGSRVPVYAGKDGWQYLDVGSNIACHAYHAKDNKYDLQLDLDRSWVEGDVSVPVDGGASSPSSSGRFPEPIVREFRSALSLTLRDGQTVESAFATDPLSGKVFKVEVGLTVLK
jgi:hypothetical protein